MASLANTREWPQADLSKGDGVHRFQFDDVDHVVAIASAAGEARTPSGAERADDLSTTGGEFDRERLNGHTSIESVVAAMTNANKRLVDEVEAMRERLESKVQPPQRKRRKLRRRQEEGDELDPMAVVQRDPDGWTRVQRTMKDRNIVRVGVNLALSAMQSADDLKYRGAAVAAIVDLLTKAGIAVEVTAFWSVSNISSTQRSSVFSFNVKESGEPLNFPKLVTAIVDAGFCRIAVFAAAARVSLGKVSWFLGQPARLPDVDKLGYDVVLDTSATTVDKAVADVLSMMQR